MRDTVSSGTTEVFLLGQPNQQDYVVVLSPAGSATIFATISDVTEINAGTAIWEASDAGTISVITSVDVSKKATAFKVAASGGDCVVEAR